MIARNQGLDEVLVFQGYLLRLWQVRNERVEHHLGPHFVLPLRVWPMMEKRTN